MLTRDAVMAAAKPSLGTLDVPEWGGEIALRHLGAVEVTTVNDEASAGRRNVLIVLFGAAAADGGRLFGDADEAWLNGQPWELILRVARAIGRHSGLFDTVEDVSGN